MQIVDNTFRVDVAWRRYPPARAQEPADIAVILPRAAGQLAADAIRFRASKTTLDFPVQ